MKTDSSGRQWLHGLADGPHFDFWHAAYNVASSDYYVGPYG